MLRQGVIPLFAHVLGGYALGALCVAAPFLLGFDAGAATALAIVAGVIVLVHEAATDAPFTLSKTVPVAVHAAVDVALAALAIAAPFLFGFSDESGATAFFIVVGVALLLLTVGTRFRGPRQEGMAGRV